MIALLLRGSLRPNGRLVPLIGALAVLLLLAFLAQVSQGNAAIAGLPAELLLPLAAAAAARIGTAGASGDTRRAIDALVDRAVAPTRALVLHWIVTFLVVCIPLVGGGLLFTLIAHRAEDLPIGKELVATAPVLLTAAAAYTSYYCFFGTFLRGTGLPIAVLIDVALGSTEGVGWFLPHHHLAALLGGSSRSLSSHGHFVWLHALVVGYALATLWRTRNPAPLAKPEHH